jgi:adenylate cyclase class 2
MTDIFIQLGFGYQKIMEKYRMNFSFLGTKISIDEMPFGMYVEIEGTEESISTVLEKFSLRQEDKILGTYWDLWTEYKNSNGIEGEDIKFIDNYTSVIMGLKI